MQVAQRVPYESDNVLMRSMSAQVAQRVPTVNDNVIIKNLSAGLSDNIEGFKNKIVRVK